MEEGEIKRLLGMWPPGSGKSIYTSVVFPTHFMGRFRNKSVIMASYGDDLPRKAGRRGRSIVKQPIYRRIFDTELSPESGAVDAWALTNGSEWMGSGILSGITGNRADGIVWDDLMKGREQADSEIIRNKTWDAYFDDLLTRKKPRAWEIGITCMVGGTKVLMDNGTTKNLRDIQRGDLVASYYNGKIIVSKVLNWRNCGPDDVFTIKTRSGIAVTANARHPFLVEREGRIEWVRLQNLSVGDLVHRVIGENGKTSNVRNAKDQPRPEASVMNIMENGAGGQGSGHHHTIIGPLGTAIYGTVMESISLLTKQCLRLREGFARFAKNTLLLAGTLPTGRGNCVLTTATGQEKYAGCCATIATIWPEKEQLKQSCNPQSNTYEIALDEILFIEPAGREDVFDVQIDRTENFVANGLISHNTRWHEDDPAGRILPVNYNGENGWIKGQDGNDWFVVCLPAICEREDDALGRKIGERIWPEWFDEHHFDPYKLVPRTWSALYQQRPAPDTGDYFKAEWLKPYRQAPARETMHIYGASDYATTTEGGDWTVHVIVGMDPDHNLYLLDVWREQASSDRWVEAFCDLVQKWRPMGWAEENGQIKAGVGPFLTRALRDRQLYVARAQFPTRGDKMIRAQSIRGRMAMNGLYVPTHAPWYSAFRGELMSFPAGRTDDQVDALGLIGQVLDKMVAGESLPRAAEPAKVLSTDPSQCTVTLTDLFEANERRRKNSPGSLRIH